MPKTYFIPVVTQDVIKFITGDTPEGGYVSAPFCETLTEAQQEMRRIQEKSGAMTLRYPDGFDTERLPNVEMIYEIKIPDAIAKTIDNKRYSYDPIHPVEMSIDLCATRIINVHSTISSNILHKPHEFAEHVSIGQRPQHTMLTLDLMKQVSAIYDFMTHVQAQNHNQSTINKNEDAFMRLKPSYTASIYALFSSDALIKQDPANLSGTDRALQLMQQQMYSNNHPSFCIYGNNLAKLFNEQVDILKSRGHRPTIDDVMQAANRAANTMNAALGLPNAIVVDEAFKSALKSPERSWPVDEKHAEIMVKQFQKYGVYIPESEFLHILHDYTSMALQVPLHPEKDSIMRTLLHTCATTSKDQQVINEINELLAKTSDKGNVINTIQSPVPMMVYGYFEGIMQQNYDANCNQEILKAFQNMLKESDGYSEMQRIGDAIDEAIQAFSHQHVNVTRFDGMDIVQQFTKSHLKAGMYSPVCFAWIPDDIRSTAEKIFEQQLTYRSDTLAMTYALAVSLDKCNKAHNSAHMMRDVSTIMNEVAMTAHRAGVCPEDISSVLNEAFNHEDNDIADNFEELE